MQKIFFIAIACFLNAANATEARKQTTFTGSWYFHQIETSQNPDFWEQLNLIQIDQHICGSWSGGAKLKQRIDSGFLVGTIKNNRANILRCDGWDTNINTLNSCPNYSGNWKDVLVRQGDKIRVYPIENNGTLGSPSVLSRLTEKVNVDKEALQSCQQYFEKNSQKNKHF